MKNEQIPKILYWKTLLIGLLFIIFGTISAIFGVFEDDAGVITAIIGVIFVLYAVYKNYRYRKTGEISFDERANLNILKASRNGFLFLAISQAILIWLLSDIDSAVFSAIFMVTWGLGCVVYAISYYAYEWGGEEKKVSLIPIGIGILGVSVVILGFLYVSQFDIKPTDTKICDILAENEENLLNIDGFAGAGIARNESTNYIIGIAIYVENNMTNIQEIPREFGEFKVFVKNISDASEFEKEKIIIHK